MNATDTHVIGPRYKKKKEEIKNKIYKLITRIMLENFIQQQSVEVPNNVVKTK